MSLIKVFREESTPPPPSPPYRLINRVYLNSYRDSLLSLPGVPWGSDILALSSVGSFSTQPVSSSLKYFLTSNAILLTLTTWGGAIVTSFSCLLLTVYGRFIKVVVGLFFCTVSTALNTRF